jgi:ankyrin repeat protein
MRGWYIGLSSHAQQHGPNAPVDELDANGCTPLMYAAMADSRLAIEMLLNFSARREQVQSRHRYYRLRTRDWKRITCVHRYNRFFHGPS